MAQKSEYRSITNRSHLFRDLIIIGSIFVLSFIIATQLDAFETVVEYVGQHEDWELDELILRSNTFYNLVRLLTS